MAVGGHSVGGTPVAGKTTRTKTISEVIAASWNFIFRRKRGRR